MSCIWLAARRWNSLWRNTTCCLILHIRQYHACWCSGDLIHWGQATHICGSKLTIIVTDNDLSQGWHQTIIWSSAEIFLLTEICISLITTTHLEVSSVKFWAFCLGLNVLRSQGISKDGTYPIIQKILQCCWELFLTVSPLNVLWNFNGALLFIHV